MSKPDEDISCSSLILEEVDKVTGNTNISSETIIISDDGGSTGFGSFFMISNSGKTIIWNTQAVGAGRCIDDDDKMNVLFRDGSRTELTNNAKFNCEGNFTLYFGGTFGKKKYLNMFSEKEIETLRIWTSDGYVEKDLNSKESQQIKQIFDCMKNMI